jgi:hypothetical protein
MRDSWANHRAQQRPIDAARQWANLEGKSATMREDLYLRCWQVHARHAMKAPAFALLVDFAAWLHVTWWLLIGT